MGNLFVAAAKNYTVDQKLGVVTLGRFWSFTAEKTHCRVYITNCLIITNFILVYVIQVNKSINDDEFIVAYYVRILHKIKFQQ